MRRDSKNKQQQIYYVSIGERVPLCRYEEENESILKKIYKYIKQFFCSN